MTQKSLVAKFRGVDDRQIRCCHSMNSNLYLGCGPGAVVYRTQDGFGLSEFYKIEEAFVTAICDYNNALFVGTSPGGGIYMHNFDTGNRFHCVISGDYQVTSFCVYNDKLYAGTSPSGLILSFDGSVWNLEYDSYGGGIKSMVVLDGSMYVFVDGVEFVPCLTSSTWSFMKNADVNFSISSSQKVVTTLELLKKKKEYDFSFNASCVAGGKIYFAPQNKCNLYSYDGKTVKMEYQWAGSSIQAIESVGDAQLFVAIDDVVYESDIT
jgi:hypothetical protein